MYIPNNTMDASRRYSSGYGVKNKSNIRLAGSCCPTRKCGCGRSGNCGCGGSQPRYNAVTPGAASGQTATMMMPNIVINVQSGNRRSNDYTDAHNASTSYSPQSSENNPLYFAPTSSEQNPFYTSYEHGGNYTSGRYSKDADVIAPQEPEVLPMILSPRAKQEAVDRSINLGVAPEPVGRAFPVEFP